MDPEATSPDVPGRNRAPRAPFVAFGLATWVGLLALLAPVSVHGGPRALRVDGGAQLLLGDGGLWTWPDGGVRVVPLREDFCRADAGALSRLSGGHCVSDNDCVALSLDLPIRDFPGCLAVPRAVAASDRFRDAANELIAACGLETWYPRPKCGRAKCTSTRCVVADPKTTGPQQPILIGDPTEPECGFRGVLASQKALDGQQLDALMDVQKELLQSGFRYFAKTDNSLTCFRSTRAYSFVLFPTPGVVGVAVIDNGSCHEANWRGADRQLLYEWAPGSSIKLYRGELGATRAAELEGLARRGSECK